MQVLRYNIIPSILYKFILLYINYCKFNQKEFLISYNNYNKYRGEREISRNSILNDITVFMELLENLLKGQFINNKNYRCNLISMTFACSLHDVLIKD